MTQYEDAKREDMLGEQKFIEAQHMVNDDFGGAIESFYCASRHFKKSAILHPTLFGSNIDRSHKIIEYADNLKFNTGIMENAVCSAVDIQVEIDPYLVDNSALINGFDDVAGMQNLKDILENELIVQLVEFDSWFKYHPYPEEQTGGFLLHGPPGCGKTFIWKAIISEIRKKGIPITALQVSLSDLINKFVGESEKNISKIFKYAKDNSPTIMVFEEFHSLANQNNDQSGHDSRVVNMLLTEIDKLKSSKGVWIIATTNYPWRIEKPMIRSGRINKHILVPPPDANARRELFRMYLEKRPISENLLNNEVLDAFVERTDGYSSADIFEITRAAASISRKINNLIDSSIIKESINNTQSSATSWCIDAIAELSLNPNLLKTYGNVYELCEKIVGNSDRLN